MLFRRKCFQDRRSTGLDLSQLGPKQRQLILKFGEEVVDLSINEILCEGITSPAWRVLEGTHLGELFTEVVPENRILACRRNLFPLLVRLLYAVA